ncbi:MAG: MarR family transcriptional regulator [Actinomycetota bacterium]|nr:MarR family transcriptional regulator [Actinomycetota bacterium]
MGAADGELPLLMVLAVKAMVAEVEAKRERPKVAGMTTMHGIAARYLDGHAGVTTVELAAHLRVTKQSASEIVGLLEREGYVRRRPHPVDRRARVVELTARGTAGLRRSRARWQALVRDWEALVAPADLAIVRRVLEAYLQAAPPDL